MCWCQRRPGGLDVIVKTDRDVSGARAAYVARSSSGCSCRSGAAGAVVAEPLGFSARDGASLWHRAPGQPRRRSSSPETRPAPRRPWPWSAGHARPARPRAGLAEPGRQRGPRHHDVTAEAAARCGPGAHPRPPAAVGRAYRRPGGPAIRSSQGGTTQGLTFLHGDLKATTCWSTASRSASSTWTGAAGGPTRPWTWASSSADLRWWSPAADVAALQAAFRAGYGACDPMRWARAELLASLFLLETAAPAGGPPPGRLADPGPGPGPAGGRRVLSRGAGDVAAARGELGARHPAPAHDPGRGPRRQPTFVLRARWAHPRSPGPTTAGTRGCPARPWPRTPGGLVAERLARVVGEPVLALPRRAGEVPARVPLRVEVPCWRRPPVDASSTPRRCSRTASPAPRGASPCSPARNWCRTSCAAWPDAQVVVSEAVPGPTLSVPPRRRPRSRRESGSARAPARRPAGTTPRTAPRRCTRPGPPPTRSSAAWARGRGPVRRRRHGRTGGSAGRRARRRRAGRRRTGARARRVRAVRWCAVPVAGWWSSTSTDCAAATPDVTSAPSSPTCAGRGPGCRRSDRYSGRPNGPCSAATGPARASTPSTSCGGARRACCRSLPGATAGWRSRTGRSCRPWSTTRRC